MIKNNKKLFDEFVIKVFPKLMNIYECNNSSLFKYLNLICSEKMISFVDKDILEKIVDLNKISFFLYRLI